MLLRILPPPESFAAQMSALRPQPVPASDIYAMQLIDEALRTLVKLYAPPAVMNTAVSFVDESLGADSVTSTQQKFISEFPPDDVYQGRDETGGISRKTFNFAVAEMDVWQRLRNCYLFIFTMPIRP